MLVSAQLSPMARQSPDHNAQTSKVGDGRVDGKSEKKKSHVFEETFGKWASSPVRRP